MATGAWPDLTEHGWASDAWPAIQAKVVAADILVLAGPIWLDDNSSVMKRCIERLYGSSHLLNDTGQYADYGRVGGCLITGNDDGVTHCARHTAGPPCPDGRSRRGNATPRPQRAVAAPPGSPAPMSPPTPN